jgi:hypothetical protein
MSLIGAALTSNIDGSPSIGVDAMRSLHPAVSYLVLCLASASPALAAPAAAPKAPASVATAPAAGVAPEALQALRRMSAYLGTLPAIELTSNASIDVVTVQGQRVGLDAVVNYKIKRPNAFVIDVNMDQKKRRFYYDGKQFTVFGPNVGFYATAPAPATIRQTLAAIDEKFGIELPLEDLFRWNDPTDNPASDLVSGFVVGTATLDGVETDHYAFRQADLDWQIWIQRGDKPLPLKVVIVDRTDPADPTYVARLTWNVSPTFTPQDFEFHPDKDAKRIRLSELAQQ